MADISPLIKSIEFELADKTAILCRTVLSAGAQILNPSYCDGGPR
jgi:hypothetical protein